MGQGETLARVANRHTSGMTAAFVASVEGIKDRLPMRAIQEALSEMRFEDVEAMLHLERLTVVKATPEEDLARLYVGIMSESATAVAPFTRDFVSADDLAAILGALDVQNPAAMRLARERAGTLIHNISRDTLQTIRELLFQSMRDGSAPRVIAQDIRRLVGLTPNQARAVQNFTDTLREAIAQGRGPGALSRFSLSPVRYPAQMTEARVQEMADKYAARQLRYRAENIARTESLWSANAGNRQLYVEMANRGVIDAGGTKMIWNAAESERTCSICSDLDGTVVGFDEDFSQTVSASGKPILPGSAFVGPHPPAHAQCLPGDALVSTSQGVAAVSERPFTGDLVIVRGASAEELTCTPNHPVLTDGGWVPAGALQVGDNVVRRRRVDRVAPSGDDHQDVPTPIQEVARAFREAPSVVAREVPVSAEDFHGDGEGSQVAVVWTDRLLRDGAHAAGGQHHPEPALVGADASGSEAETLVGLRASDEGLYWAGLAPHGVMCGPHLVGALLGGHAGPLDAFGITRPPVLDAVIAESGVDDTTGDAEAFADGIDRIAGQERGDDLALGELDSGGHYYLERVASVERRPFDGTVYNMETLPGFYHANWYVVSNCRCSLDYEVG